MSLLLLCARYDHDELMTLILMSSRVEGVCSHEMTKLQLLAGIGATCHHMRQVVKRLLERQPTHREFERFLLRLRVAQAFLKDAQACFRQRLDATRHETRIRFLMTDSYTWREEERWCAVQLALTRKRNDGHTMASVRFFVREEALFCGEQSAGHFARENALVMALATPAAPVSIYAEDETDEQCRARKYDELSAMVCVPHYGNFYFEVLVGETLWDGALRFNERKRYTGGAFAGVLEQGLLVGLPSPKKKGNVVGSRLH